MFREWDLEHLLGRFPAHNMLEIRVDGETRLFGADPYTSEYSAQLVPQQALVRNLIKDLLDNGGDLRFEAVDVTLHRLGSARPAVRYTRGDGTAREIECDFVAGCDGDHGVSNASVPGDAVTAHTFDYGITWLTILADAPPPQYPLMASGQRGYAAQYCAA